MNECARLESNISSYQDMLIFDLQHGLFAATLRGVVFGAQRHFGPDRLRPGTLERLNVELKC
jgi:hypothetical protein